MIFNASSTEGQDELVTKSVWRIHDPSPISELASVSTSWFPSHLAVENIIEKVILLCQAAQQSNGLHLNKGK